MAKDKDLRGRNYATVVYPESAPENWLDILSELKMACFVSPLHDQDINPSGEQKKPHYHVLLMFDSLKSDVQVEEIFLKIGGVGREKVISRRGYARYLCHLDNPEKAQYDTQKVKMYGGADYLDTIGLALDKYTAIGEMIDFCKENDVEAYSDLLEWCRENRFDWFRALCDNSSYVILEYLKSRTWKAKNEADKLNSTAYQEWLKGVKKNDEEGMGKV